MSLPAQNPSHQPAVTVTGHSSHSVSPTPNLRPSALPNDSSPHSKHAADDSTTSTPQLVPFFTLIEDVHTTQHHHPTVHYIFADDSTDLITEAALRTLEPPPSSPPTPSHHQNSQNSNETTGPTTSTSDTDPANPTALPPPRPGVLDRYILLDLSHSPAPPSGEPVLSAHAHSLTSDWQVLNVELSHAPTWDEEPDAQGRGAGGVGRNRPLMLKIEGTEGVRGGEGLETGDGKGEVDVEGLVGVFERRMVELRRLIAVESEAGGGPGGGHGAG